MNNLTSERELEPSAANGGNVSKGRSTTSWSLQIVSTSQLLMQKFLSP